MKTSTNFENCVAPEFVQSAPNLSVVALGPSHLVYRLRLIERLPNGAIQQLSETWSLQGLTTANIQPNGREILVAIVPVGDTALNDKDLNVSHVRDAASGNAHLMVSFNEPVRTPSAPTPQYPTPICNRNGQCAEPWRQPSNILQLSESSNATSAVTCTAENSMPEQVASNSFGNKMDTNAEIANAKRVAEFANSLPHSGMARRTYLVHQFGPGQRLDVKNNPQYLMSSNYGNSLYGAMGRAMGFSRFELIHAAAVVQQYQDYQKVGHEAYKDFGALAAGVAQAMIFGNNDGPTDAANIDMGIKYFDEVWSKDANQASVADSCTKAPKPRAVMTGSGTEPGPRSWWNSDGAAQQLLGSCWGIGCRLRNYSVTAGPVTHPIQEH
ncbi:polymorphic toxin type 44 domain-containing protein [Roseateles chitinivorans]|uniref:polymorphic toxin type 44 domain-containing protein n=2 Tax=Roseateles TaxID=93681 RepID=UPI003D66D59E